jgi:hypothetical protein
MVFRRNRLRIITVLIVAISVSSFAPSTMNSKQIDRVESMPMALLNEIEAIDEPNQKLHSKDRATKKKTLQRTNAARLKGSFPVPGRQVFAAFLIFGSIFFVSPNPTAAIPDSIPPPPMQTTTSTPDSSPKSSYFTDPKDWRIQPKYLDLAGEFKEELKFRAQQGKEKVGEKAKEFQEQQQAAAEIRDAKNKEFDDMFDQAEKERNDYYSKKIISSETYLQTFKAEEATEDRSGYDNFMQAFNPDAAPVDELKLKLEQNLAEEKRLRAALEENSRKDPNDRETKVERTLLKISVEKNELQTAKLRKDIALEGSLDSIRLQRQAEIKVIQEKAEAREREKQEQIEKIRLAKEQEKAEFLEIRALKKQQAKELRFSNQQSIFDRKFDDLDRFEQRKEILATKEKKEDAAKVRGLVNDLNRLAVDGAAANTPGEQTTPPPTP